MQTLKIEYATKLLLLVTDDPDGDKSCWSLFKSVFLKLYKVVPEIITHFQTDLDWKIEKLEVTGKSFSITKFLGSVDY